MARIVSIEEAQAQQSYSAAGRMRVPFMEPTAATPDEPQCFLSQQDPGRKIEPHYHLFDQWIYIFGGHGVLGRAPIGPGFVHFTRAFTPYGPLISDNKSPLMNLVMFPCYQPGAQYMSEARDALHQTKDRRPFQLKHKIDVPAASGPIDLRAIAELQGERGLGAYTLSLAPGAATTAPDPTISGGQYVVVTKGSLWRADRECRALTIAHIRPEDGPLRVQAGAEGLEAVIFSFPQTVAHQTRQVSPQAASTFRKWECMDCGLVYDEATGAPEFGLAPGTRWEDVPEDWLCPDCSEPKSAFRLIESA